MNLTLPAFSIPQTSGSVHVVVAFGDTMAPGDALFLNVTLGGQNASFSLDGSTMTLTTGPGSSGSIDFHFETFGLTSLINYQFNSSSVVVSSNSLGLALPTVGSSPSFSVATPTFPGPGPLTQVYSFSSLDLQSNPNAPEPSTAFLGLLGLLGIKGALVLRKRHRSTNDASAAATLKW